jgi:hypothetical protein
MKRLLPILSLFFLLIGCSGKNSIPAGVLPKQKMQAVLLDMLKADEFLTGYVFPKDSVLNSKQESIQLYEQVFRIHHTDREEFKRSFLFYQSHPSLMKEILDSLNKKQPSLPTQRIQPITTDTTARGKTSPVGVQ